MYLHPNKKSLVQYVFHKCWEYYSSLASLFPFALSLFLCFEFDPWKIICLTLEATHPPYPLSKWGYGEFVAGQRRAWPQLCSWRGLDEHCSQQCDSCLGTASFFPSGTHRGLSRTNCPEHRYFFFFYEGQVALMQSVSTTPFSSAVLKQ